MSERAGLSVRPIGGFPRISVMPLRALLGRVISSRSASQHPADDDRMRGMGGFSSSDQIQRARGVVKPLLYTRNYASRQTGPGIVASIRRIAERQLAEAGRPPEAHQASRGRIHTPLSDPYANETQMRTLRRPCPLLNSGRLFITNQTKLAS